MYNPPTHIQRKSSATLKKRTVINAESSEMKASESRNTIYEMCVTDFKSLDIKNKSIYDTPNGKPIKQMINKYRKICHKIIAPDRCYLSELPSLISKIKKKYLKITSVDIRAVKVGEELASLYNFYNEQLKLHIDKDILKADLIKYNIKYKGQLGIDAGGLGRQFAENVAQQLFTGITPLSKKLKKRRSHGPDEDYTKGAIFVEFEKDTDIYVFNQDINPELFIYDKQIPSKEEIFEFAGKVYAWLMANGVKCQNRLSKAILLNLLYNKTEITLDDYGIILLLESKAASNNYIAILQLIEDGLAEATYAIDANKASTSKAVTSKKLQDIMDLYAIPLNFPNKSDASKTVEFSTFGKFLGSTGKHTLLGPNNTYIDAFKKGFFIKSGWMKNKDFNIPLLDYLTYGLEVSDVVMKKIIDVVVYYSNYNSYIPHVDYLVTNFIEILANNNGEKERIYDKVLEKALKNTEGKVTQLQLTINTPKTYNEFRGKLLKFWSGSSTYNNFNKYTISIVNHGYKVKANTCRFRLDIPLNTIKYIEGKGNLEVPFASAHKDDLFVEIISSIIEAGNLFNDK